jgi:D-xylose transport system permease protein
MAVMSERMGINAGLAITIAILVGAAAGFINGFFVAIVRVPSFIVTLASSIFFAGLLLRLLLGDATLNIQNPFILSIAGSAHSYLPDYLGVGLPTAVLVLYAASLIFNYIQRQRTGLKVKPILQVVGQIVLAVGVVEGVVLVLEDTPSPIPGVYLGVPNSTVIWFGLLLIIWLVLTKTRFGRYIYSTGGNREASRRAGIPVTWIRIAAFTLCSAIAAVGGIIAASRADSVQAAIDPTLQLEAIAAAVIGGVSLFGGYGSVWAIVLGALIIGSIKNGLSLNSAGSDVQQMVEGAVLILAVTLDALARRAQKRAGL